MLPTMFKIILGENLSNYLCTVVTYLSFKIFESNHTK